MPAARLLVVLAIALLGPAAAAAPEADCPPPPEAIPRGLQVRAAIGPAIWTGQVGANSRVGFSFSLQAAYELWPFLALEATWNSAVHETDQPPPPLPGTFSTHALHGGLRLALPLGRFDLFARGGVGLQWTRPDILVRIEGFDSDFKLGWLGGAGFVWHTPRKHFWLGLEGDAQGAVGFPDVLVSVHLLVGWTL
jgi:hypothetical protein